MSFFQTFWVMLKVDIMGNLQHSHQHQMFEKNLIATSVALFPKKNSTTELGDFRPLSLISGVYKIIAKLLVERLKKGGAQTGQQTDDFH